jgi:N-acetylmuramoyl-L-alanine amidase
MRIIFSLFIAAAGISTLATEGAAGRKAASFAQQTTQQAPQQAPQQGQQQEPPQAPAMPALPFPTLNVVVLDPAHGGTDAGARGAGGINESDVVLDFARSIRVSLEAKGFRVVQTRSGADNPSFDDRSAVANAQRGAIFITLHVSSTGTPGQVRVYSEPLAGSAQLAATGQSPAPVSFPTHNGLLPWDRAQEPYAAASHRFAELMQAALTQKFSGSPAAPEFAAVRQLRTVGAPAIAIEVSSVSVSNRDQLTQMSPGLADTIAQVVASFKPIYEGGAH